MKIILHYAGRSKRRDWVSEGSEHYRKRLQGFCPFELRAYKVSSAEQWKQKVLQALDTRHRLYLLDERGAAWKSPRWASEIEGARMDGVTCLHFAIGRKTPSAHF